MNSPRLSVCIVQSCKNPLLCAPCYPPSQRREFGEHSRQRCADSRQLRADRMLWSSPCTSLPLEQRVGIGTGPPCPATGRLQRAFHNYFLVLLNGKYCLVAHGVITPSNKHSSVLSIFQASVHRRVSLRSECLTGGDGLKQIQATLHGKFFFFVRQLF